jgi:hypothetical protein
LRRGTHLFDSAQNKRPQPPLPLENGQSHEGPEAQLRPSLASGTIPLAADEPQSDSELIEELGTTKEAAARERILWKLDQRLQRHWIALGLRADKPIDDTHLICWYFHLFCNLFCKATKYRSG